MKTYYCTMDDGLTMSFKKHDAATAIQCALEDAPGHKVVKCTAGMPGGQYGCITFDVPNHQALPDDYVKPKKTRRGT